MGTADLGKQGHASAILPCALFTPARSPWRPKHGPQPTSKIVGPSLTQQGLTRTLALAQSGERWAHCCQGSHAHVIG